MKDLISLLAVLVVAGLGVALWSTCDRHRAPPLSLGRVAEGSSIVPPEPLLVIEDDVLCSDEPGGVRCVADCAPCSESRALATCRAALESSERERMSAWARYWSAEAGR